MVHQDPVGREDLVSKSVNPGEVSGAVDLSRVRVLMVDDDSDACEILRRVLQEYGAIVDSAPSVMQALEHLKQVSAQHHHLIISDIGMPECPTWTAMNSRGDRSGGTTIPAIAVTAFAGSEDRMRALQAGFNMYLVKPLEPQELVKV
jgi:CheY-like chemotaxis protein